MNVERPLDFLNDLKISNKKVIVERRGEKNIPIQGRLIAFDIHINLVVETGDGLIFIKGDVVETVSPCN